MSDPATPEPVPNTTPTPDDPQSVPVEPRPEYEFNAAENAVLNSLTQGMLWVRLPLFILGLFQLLIGIGLAFRLRQDGAHIVGIMGHVLAAIVCFLLAHWLLKAASAFIRVTTTTGHDITNLMIGIRSLAVWFDTLAFFVKLYLALLSVLLIILLVGLFAGAFRGPG
jgi:FtsH-binding integral membrane protein